MKRYLSYLILALSFLSYLLIPSISNRADKVVSQDVLTILPEDAPATLEFKTAKDKFKALDMTLLILESDKKEDLEKFYSDFKDDLAHDPLPHVSKVIWDIKEIVDFFGKYSPLYIPEDVYLYILTSLEKDKFLEGNKKKTDLSLKDERKKLITDMKRSFKNIYYKHRNTKFSRFKSLQDGKFISEDGLTALAVIIHPEALTSLKDIEKFNLEIDRRIEKNKQHSPSVKVMKSGDTNALYNEYRALWDGFGQSAVLSLVFTFVILFALFRNFKAIFLVAHSLVVGIILSAFFIVQYFEVINANAIFLLIVVLGNAVNSNIVLLHYFFTTRHEGIPHESAGLSALKKSIWPTSFAVATSCIVYFSFYGLEFRGYHDMSIVGIAGMLIAWIVGIAILMASFLTGWGKFSDTDVQKYMSKNFLAWDKVFNFVINNNKKIIALTSLFIIAGLFYIPRFDELRELDSNQLKNERFVENSLEKIAPKLEKVGLSIEFLPQMVVVTENEKSAFALQTLINEDKFLRSKLQNLNTFTVRDLLPRDQERAIKAINELIKSYPQSDILESPYISKWQEKLTKDAFEFDTKLRVKDSDLPPDLKSLFVDRTGNIGNVIYLSFNLNKLERDVRDIRAVVARIKEIAYGKQIYIAGTIPLLADIERISYDARNDVLLMCILMVLFLIIVFNLKSPQFIGAYIFTFLAIASIFYLFIFLTGTKINLLNFMALPMTMVLGIDYISNYAKGFELGVNRQNFQGKTFSMVVTMSFTTCFGYLSIYLTSPQLALMSFAKLAMVGEILTLFGGLVFFFSFLTLQNAILKKNKPELAGSV